MSAIAKILIRLVLLKTLFIVPGVLAAKSDVMRLEVIDPFVELHTGPGRGYPVFYVIEQGESVELVTRRPDWYEVKAPNGRLGWATTSQLSRTIQSTGEPADLPSVSYGDYLKNSLRVGFTVAHFVEGELTGSDSHSLTGGYRPYSWLGLELEAGKVFGTDIKGTFYAANAQLEPFSHWLVSPYFLLGAGSMAIDSQPKLTPLEIQESSYTNFALGASYYLGRNFVVKGEYRAFTVSTENDNVSLGAWKIGFNTFF